MSTYVPIYVDEADYPEALRLLLPLLIGPGTESPVRPDARVEIPAEPDDDGEWNADEWRKIWRGVTDNTRKALVLFAENRDELVSMADLEELIGSYGLVNGALSSLTKNARKHARSDSWPFEIEEKDGRAAYRMDGRRAAIVLNLARGT